MPKYITIDKKFVRDEVIQQHLDEVNKEFRHSITHLSAEICSFETMKVAIEIEWGDWKHEHAYADYVMRQHGFCKVDEKVTEEDGSDCYSSIHYYWFC